MNEEQAIKAIKRVRNAAIVINLFFIIVPVMIGFILPKSNLDSGFITFIIITEIFMLGILNGLVLGIYRFKSRVCAIVLFLCTILMLIGSLSTGQNTPLLIYAILLYIYYKGIRATYYFHNNKLANY